MRQTNILLVEDNDDDIDLTLRALSHHNITNKVVVALNGDEALDYLFSRGQYADRKSQEMPAVILLDLNLPGKSGLETLELIRGDERTKYIPVVILTTSLNERDLECSYEKGANSYVRKPVDFKQFVDAVQRLGIYWTLNNEVPEGKSKCLQ